MIQVFRGQSDNAYKNFKYLSPVSQEFQVLGIHPTEILKQKSQNKKKIKKKIKKKKSQNNRNPVIIWGPIKKLITLSHGMPVIEGPVVHLDVG